MFLPQHVVVHVVRRGDFQAAGAELDVHVAVFDHRNRPPHQRHDHPFAFEPRVFGVVRIDAHRRVAHDRFGTRGRHHRVCRFAFGRIFDHVAQVIEFAVLLFVDHLFVRDGGQGRRIPVHHPHAAVNLTLVVQVHENVDHRVAQPLVHRELRPRPVARSAQLLELFEDDPAVFFFPLPSVSEELFAREVGLFDTFGGQFLHYFRLGGDRRVVGARHPAGVFALHPRPAHQHVLDGVVQHVPHVQNPRHVGRRNHDRIGFAAVRLRMEKSVVQPVLVPFVLLFGRVVFGRYLCHFVRFLNESSFCTLFAKVYGTQNYKTVSY